NKQRLFKDTFNFRPLQLGFKVNLLKSKGIIPQISLIAHTGFNRIASKFGREGSFFSPSFRFSLQNSITENFAIGYNFGAEWDDTNEPPVWLYTFAPGFNLGEKWYAYVEAFGFFYKDYAPAHSLDAGIAYYINNNIKVDASAGVGISKAAPCNYVSAGFSFRLNTKKK
ncbi:MAG TPA: transporter, partial [Chitinophagaceae bacterium]|nr:transporter [Chitinophagaceae bacterium]